MYLHVQYTLYIVRSKPFYVVCRWHRRSQFSYRSDSGGDRLIKYEIQTNRQMKKYETTTNRCNYQSYIRYIRKAKFNELMGKLCSTNLSNRIDAISTCSKYFFLFFSLFCFGWAGGRFMFLEIDYFHFRV